MSEELRQEEAEILRRQVEAQGNPELFERLSGELFALRAQIHADWKALTDLRAEMDGYLG